MAFFGFLIFWAITFIAGQLLRAATKTPKPPKGELEIPTAEEGGQIPAIFGTVKIAPNTLWFGDRAAVPVKKRVSTGLFTSTRQTIGYKYLVGMQGGLCWGPVDALVDIILADKYKASDINPIDYRKEIAGLVLQVTASGVSPSLPIAQSNGTAITFDAPFVYGGPEKEGGVSGTVRFYFGTTGQSANSYLGTHASAIAGVAYKGLCYVVWEHTDMGQSQYLKQWQFVLRRCPTTLGALIANTSLSRIGDDANPAEVIYELLTDSRWGLGRPSTDLDISSFTDALQTLSSEGLGISGTHVGASTADEQVKKILGTIDGVLAPNPLTGLIGLKLIRADYVVDDLEVFDPSNSNTLTYSRPDAGELTTEVKVRYTDASQLFTTRVRPAYNPALRAIAGRDTTLSVDYPLITTGANADRLALRDLKAVSSTLATGSIVGTRAGSHLAPGDPFVIDYPDEGLTAVVVRATRINYGSPHSSEDIEIQWTEDVFGVSDGVFTTDPPSVFVPPTPPSFGSVVVIPEFTLSSTQGCVTLQITGAVSSISTIEMRRQKGGEAVEAWVTFAIDDPPLLCVDRDDIDTGVIAWRVTVTEADGTTDTIEDEQEVPPLGADDGNAQGTPGNFALTLLAGSPHVARNVDAALNEPKVFKRARKYVNTSKINKARIQHNRWESSDAGLEIHWAYSLTGGPPFAESGVLVRADRQNFPEPGDFLSLVAGAIGPNVLFTLATKGGSGTSVIKTSDLFIEAVSGEPPISPAPIPPDVPTGGPLGALLLDLNAMAEFFAAFVNGQSVPIFHDDSVSANDGAPNNGASVSQTAGTYQTNGLGTGLPSVRIGSDTNGYLTNNPTNGAQTWYFVLGNVTGAGSEGTSSNNINAIVLATQLTSGSGIALTAAATEKLLFMFNSISVAPNSQLTSASYPTGPYLIRLACQTASGQATMHVNGTLVLSLSGGFAGSMTATLACFGNTSTESDKIRIDYGRILCYDTAHSVDDAELVESVLRDLWGL